MNVLAAAATTSNASAVFALLASAVIVLGGLAALIRAIWKTATLLRDNTTATRALTSRMDHLDRLVAGTSSASAAQYDKLTQRVEALERKIRP